MTKKNIMALAAALAILGVAFYLANNATAWWGTYSPGQPDILTQYRTAADTISFDMPATPDVAAICQQRTAKGKPIGTIDDMAVIRPLCKWSRTLDGQARSLYALRCINLAERITEQGQGAAGGVPDRLASPLGLYATAANISITEPLKSHCIRLYAAEAKRQGRQTKPADWFQLVQGRQATLTPGL